MTAFALSTNPNTVFDPNVDVLNIDTADASGVSIAQIGNNVVITDTSGHTATLQNILIQQLTSTHVIGLNGSALFVGDQTTAVNDDGANTLTGGTGGDQVFASAATIPSMEVSAVTRSMAIPETTSLPAPTLLPETTLCLVVRGTT